MEKQYQGSQGQENRSYASADSNSDYSNTAVLMSDENRNNPNLDKQSNQNQSSAYDKQNSDSYDNENAERLEYDDFE